MAKNDEWNRVKTVETAFDIIQTIQRLDGPTMADIVDEHDLAKSTAYRHLKTLFDLGYIVKKDTSFYLSLEFLWLGEQTRSSRVPFEHVESVIDNLASETEEQAQFFIEEHNRARYVYFARGAHAVRTDSLIGRAAPLHYGSGGKAILAAMSDERIQEVIDDVGLPAATEYTITDEDELWEEIEETRERGYAINDREYIEGLRGLGIAVLRPDDSICGGISVSGPANRLSGKRFTEELPEILLGMANELEINIAYA